MSGLHTTMVSLPFWMFTLWITPIKLTVSNNYLKTKQTKKNLKLQCYASSVEITVSLVGRICFISSLEDWKTTFRVMVYFYITLIVFLLDCFIGVTVGVTCTGLSQIFFNFFVNNKAKGVSFKIIISVTLLFVKFTESVLPL